MAPLPLEDDQAMPTIYKKNCEVVAMTDAQKAATSSDPNKGFGESWALLHTLCIM